MDDDARFWRQKYAELLQAHTQVMALLTREDTAERVEQAKTGIAQLVEMMKDAQAKQQANGTRPALKPLAATMPKAMTPVLPEPGKVPQQ